jgi:hypothetical protein
MTLYVGGGFTTYRSVVGSAIRIAKLSTSDGNIDTSFHPVSGTGGFNSSVFSLALNSSETTLYAGGGFATYRSVANSAKRIAKLSTSDGSIDTSFHPVSAAGGFAGGTVYTLALNSTGSTLYAGGNFTSYRGVTNSANLISKLSTADGSIDTTFHPVSATGGFNVSSVVRGLALNSTGTALFVGGSFTAYRSVANSARGVAKLSTTDGSIDTSFHPVFAMGGFDNTVQTIALNSAGSGLYVGGIFATYRAAICNNAGLINADNGDAVLP